MTSEATSARAAESSIESETGQSRVTPLQSAARSGQRLVFLDVVRGMTVAFMILVNNNGDEQAAYWPLKHSDWNGWTPTDLVFPVFLFLVGIAIVLSTRARLARGESKRALLRHAARRAAILFALGILIHGFPSYPLATLRVYGVLQRIAICYLIVTLLYIWDRRAATLAGVGLLCMVGYWVLLRWIPIPGFGVPGRDFPFLDKDINWVSVVDRRLFPGRLLEHTRDPLGLVSTIPAVATCLLGVLTGLWLRGARRMRVKAAGMLAAGISGLLLGQLWAIAFPINKRLWTSSYVLFAGGWTLLILFAAYVVIDMRKHGGAWTYPWRVFGANAIFAYALSEVLSTVLEMVRVGSADHVETLKNFLYQRIFAPVGGPPLASLLYSLAYVLMCFLPCAGLFRRRIFLKI